MAATIKQRISFEGSEEILKKFQQLGQTGAAAFKQIQDAASKPIGDPGQIDKITKAVAQLTSATAKLQPQLQELSKTGGSQFGNNIARDAQTSYRQLLLVGNGLTSVADKSKITTSEIRALGRVVSSVGLGQLAGLSSSLFKVSTALGLFGGAALGIGVAGAALVKFGIDALNTVKMLDQLSRASGTSFQSLAAMQKGFALVGISVKQFEDAFTSLNNKILSDAPKIAQTIEQSNLKAIQSEIALAKARSMASGKDPSRDEQLRILALVKQAGALEIVIAKQEALAASANKLDDVIRQFLNLSQGIRTTINPLTTVKTQADAVTAILAKAGGSVRDFAGGLTGLPPDLRKVALAAADLFSKMDPITRLRIGKELGIPPEVIETLAKGRAEVEKLLAAGAKMAATDAQAQALRDLGIAWTEFTATVAAESQKMAAASAPAFIELLAAARSSVSQLATLPVGESLLRSLQGVGGVLKAVFVDTWVEIGSQILQGWAIIGSKLAELVTTPIGGAWQWISDTFTSVMEQIVMKARTVWNYLKGLFTSSPAGGGDGGEGESVGAFARGGLLGGRGTGTSDSNLAWLSRGEYVVPARAVRQPGVLRMLEALRRSGGSLRGILDDMGRFARGGLVGSLPAFAEGGVSGGGRNLGTLTLGLPNGTSVNVRASSDAVAQLYRASVHSQISSTGRQPSWKR